MLRRLQDSHLGCCTISTVSTGPYINNLRNAWHRLLAGNSYTEMQEYQHHVGQMICLGCGGSIIKASSQQQRRRVKAGRWFQEEAAARATGKRRSELAVDDVISNMRREAGNRGLQSLDSAALEKAKQIFKLAERQGYSSIVDRFDNDVEYTLSPGPKTARGQGLLEQL